jgi:hypothetical protein
MIVVVILSGLFSIAIANLNAPLHEQSYFQAVYQMDYITHQLSFLKWVGLMTTLFMGAHGFVYNQYDALFINMQSSTQYLFSKIMVVLLITWVIIYCAWATGIIVGCFTAYHQVRFVDFKHLVYVSQFVGYYGLLGIALLLTIKHISALIIPFSGYIMTFLMTNPTTVLDDYPNYLVWLHLIFPDILIDGSQNVVFLWGFLTITVLTVVILTVIYKQCKVTV